MTLPLGSSPASRFTHCVHSHQAVCMRKQDGTVSASGMRKRVESR